MNKDNDKAAAQREKALDAFMGTMAEIRDRMAELQNYVDDHMFYAVDSIDWGCVGSAEHLLCQLTELTDAAYKKGEYAE